MAQLVISVDELVWPSKQNSVRMLNVSVYRDKREVLGMLYSTLIVFVEDPNKSLRLLILQPLFMQLLLEKEIHPTQPRGRKTYVEHEIDTLYCKK